MQSYNIDENLDPSRNQLQLSSAVHSCASRCVLAWLANEPACSPVRCAVPLAVRQADSHALNADTWPQARNKVNGTAGVIRHLDYKLFANYCVALQTSILVAEINMCCDFK